MAVVQYSNVYRSGAASGAPVTSIYICDTTAELPAGIPGDIALLKDTGYVYVYNQNWFLLMRADAKMPFTGNPIIQNTPRPVLTINDTAWATKVRLYSISGICHLATNCSFNGAGWAVDDSTKDGQIIAEDVNSSALIFYRVRKADGGVEQRIRIDMNTGALVSWGALYERSRATAVGDWINKPYDSSDYSSPQGGSWAMPNGNTYYYYTLVGSTFTMMFMVNQAVLSGVPSNLRIKLPLGLVNNVDGRVPINYGGQMGCAIIQNGYNFIDLAQGYGFDAFAVGTHYISFNLSWGIR